MCACACACAAQGPDDDGSGYADNFSGGGSSAGGGRGRPRSASGRGSSGAASPYSPSGPAAFRAHSHRRSASQEPVAGGRPHSARAAAPGSGRRSLSRSSAGQPQIDYGDGDGGDADGDDLRDDSSGGGVGGVGGGGGGGGSRAGGSSVGGESSDFAEFLARQQYQLVKRAERLDRVRRETDPVARPQLTRRSARLVAAASNAAHGSDFLARVEQSAARRKAWLEERALLDEECTFTPLITNYSRSLRPRTASELSVGDQAKKATRLEIARMYMRQTELAAAPFRPAIPPPPPQAQAGGAPVLSSARADGVLKITSEPETYVERVAHQQRAQELKRRLMQQIMSQAKHSECTFKPVVRDSPAYVKKIAARHVARALSSRLCWYTRMI
jgi:hypothetical protein